jgi:tetratricopeptide (TPR) repeat protein
MNPRFSVLPILGGLMVPIVSIVPANAQQGDDVGTLVTNSLTLMNAQKWDEALALLTRADERFGKNALQLFGPQFGVVLYRKGICEMKTKKWEDAMKSFERCYRDFPNDGAVAGGGNIFQKKALLKWGEAAQGAEDWNLAIRQFKKFLEERDKTRDDFPQGAFYINMAICHYKLAKIPEGNENLEIAIKNNERFPPPDAGIVAGFQALVGAVIEKRNEQALLDFVEKNRGDITAEPFEMVKYAKIFMKLAGDAIGADMQRGAMALYHLVPATEVALDDTEARLKSLAARPGVRDGGRNIVNKELAAQAKMLEDERRGNKPTEVIKLGATAFIHEKNGNPRGAYAAYEQLELYYPKAEKREDNLYNLVRTSSIIGEVFATEGYGQKFLKDFPNSTHVPAVRRMMLSSLFYEGEYDTCIEVASAMIDQLEVGTKEHDICVHVLGGSYYYTGKYDKAQPLLDQHVEKYPESQFAEAALYFQASNLSRLQFWAKAAKLLDAFFEKYPDPQKNTFYAFALYDRANCHYAEDENEQALEKLNRLDQEFPNAEIMDMALNLRGNVQQTLGSKEDAEQSYLKALELAERRENEVVAGEALYYLVAMLGDKGKEKDENPRLKDAVPYADKFWKEHGQDSPYKIQVAVSQVYALGAVGRGEEALNRLRDVIAEMAANPETAFGLEEAINSYTDVYLESHTPEELKEHYYNFPGIRASDKAARALLRIAVIGVFEDVSKKSAEDEAKKRSADAMIKVLFQELKVDFSPKELTNYILVKLGDYLRTNTAAPIEALPYYDEAISRTDLSYRFPALFGRGDVYARSKDKANIAKGIEDFQRVFADSQDNGEREMALFRTVESRMAMEDFNKAAEDAKRYLDKKENNFSKYAPQVGMILAQTYDKRGEVNDAIAMYVKVWSAHMGNIPISAPAVKRWMELSWQRNLPGSDAETPGDRQGAYQGGWNFINLTSRPEFKNKMTEDELALWSEVEKLTKQYEADPSIKSMAEIEKEKAAGRR